MVPCVVPGDPLLSATVSSVLCSYFSRMNTCSLRAGIYSGAFCVFEHSAGPGERGRRGGNTYRNLIKIKKGIGQ